MGSGALRRRNRRSATSGTHQITAVVFSTRRKRLAATVTERQALWLAA